MPKCPDCSEDHSQEAFDTLVLMFTDFASGAVKANDFTEARTYLAAVIELGQAAVEIGVDKTVLLVAGLVGRASDVADILVKKEVEEVVEGFNRLFEGRKEER